MTKLVSPFVFILVLFVLALPARAESVPAFDLLDAGIDYTAEYYVTTDGKSEYRGTVIHAPGRERRDFTTGSGAQTLILRRDIGEATMMWPERKWYIAMPLEAVASLVGDLDGVLVERKKSGTERVGGESCARYDVTARGGGETLFSGRMWFSGDGILMKADGWTTYRGRRTKVETALAQVRRIKADPSAFVRPSDYKGLPLDPAKLGLKMP